MLCSTKGFRDLQYGVAGQSVPAWPWRGHQVSSSCLGGGTLVLTLLLLLPRVPFPSSGAAPNMSSQTCSQAPKPRPYSFSMVSPHTPRPAGCPAMSPQLSTAPCKVATSQREHLSPHCSAEWEPWEPHGGTVGTHEDSSGYLWRQAEPAPWLSGGSFDVQGVPGTGRTWRSEHAGPPLTRLQLSVQAPMRCQVGWEGSAGQSCPPPVRATSGTTQLPILSPTIPLLQAGQRAPATRCLQTQRPEECSAQPDVSCPISEERWNVLDGLGSLKDVKYASSGLPPTHSL